MKRNKYPDGFRPKIQFYSHKVKDAIESGKGLDSVEYYLKKLNYFYNRERERTEKLKAV